MKRSLTLFALLVIFLSPVWAQPIPNSSFENWTAAGGYSTPDGWDNLNSYSAVNSIYTCEKGTTGAPHGSAYLKLTSRVVGSTKYPGLAVCGKYDVPTKRPLYGFPCAGRPAFLTGKWQYMAYGTDTGRIAVYLTKWNTTTNKADLVGIVEYDLPGMVMSWASFAIPIAYLSSEMPDSAVIGLTPSNRGITDGSYLYLDSLNFYGVASAVQNTAYPKYHLTLYPNPAKDNITVDLGMTATNDTKLWVVDLYGRVPTEAVLTAGKHAYSISVKTILAGLYFVKLQLGEETLSQKLVVE